MEMTTRNILLILCLSIFSIDASRLRKKRGQICYREFEVNDNISPVVITGFIESFRSLSVNDAFFKEPFVFSSKTKKVMQVKVKRYFKGFIGDDSQVFIVDDGEYRKCPGMCFKLFLY